MIEIFLFCVVAAVTILFVKNKPSDVGQYPDGVKPEDGETTPSSAHGHGCKTASSGKVYRSPVDWKVSNAMRTKTIWLIVVGAISFLMTFSTFMAHGVIHLQDAGLTHEVAAFSVALMLGVSIGGRLLSGVLGDRIEPRYIYACALIVMSLGSMAAMKVSSSVVYMYVYAACIGIGFGASYVCQSAMIANYFGAQAFASVMGIVFPIMSITANLGPYFTGLIYDAQKSYQIAFSALAAFTFIGAVAIILAKPPAMESA
jgi:MFS family permease